MKKAPALFIGHGSPMNVIEDNDFNRTIKEIGQKINTNEVSGIICISAHYQTDGINIDGNISPRTIHDFSGFPDILYKMEYNAEGSPHLAEKLKEKLKAYKATITTNWGLDHGAWNILWHLFPKADVPVVMLSLDHNLTFRDHMKIGEILKELRNEGILILGSGNVVHSFKGINFTDDAPINHLANTFNEFVAEKIVEKDFHSLIDFNEEINESAKFSVNSAEHYLPLLYILGACDKNEKAYIFNNKIVYSTLSMLSVGFGL